MDDPVSCFRALDMRSRWFVERFILPFRSAVSIVLFKIQQTRMKSYKYITYSLYFQGASGLKLCEHQLLIVTEVFLHKICTCITISIHKSLVYRECLVLNLIFIEPFFSNQSIFNRFGKLRERYCIRILLSFIMMSLFS